MPVNHRSPYKKRVRKHVIADLSANYVERFILKCNYIPHFFDKDYGFDLNVHTFNKKKEFEDGLFYIQLKASDKIKYPPGKRAIAFSADMRDLRRWHKDLNPVFLIMYDAKREQAFWLYIQQYLRQNPKFKIDKIKNDTYTIKIPLANTVDIQAIRQFRRHKQNNIKDSRKYVQYR